MTLGLARLFLRVERPAWTIWCLRGTIRRESNHAEARELFAWALAGAGRLEEAAEAYRGLMAQARDSGAMAVIAWHFGSVLLRLERPSEALGVFDAGIVAEPRAAKLHYNRGYALRCLDRHSEAADAYQRALRCDPSLHEGYAALVETLGDLQRWEKECEVAKQWLDIEHSAKAAHALGNSLMMLGRFEEAVAALEDARRLSPDSNDILSSLAGALDELGQSAKAEQILRDAIRRHATAASLHVVLPYVLSSMGRHDEAIAAANTAIRLAPDVAAAHAALGSVLLEAGHADRALHAFEHALSLGPVMLEWQASRGAALSKIGRHDEALRAFDAVTAVDPEFFEKPRGSSWSTYLTESRRLAR
jgi:tetratricopeptide (TPR) repeat protein